MTASPRNIVEIAPYTQEGEEALIGAVIVNPDGYFIAEHILPDHFFIKRHAYIWEAICRIIERRDELTFISLQDELRAMKKLDEIGGAAYILKLVNATGDSTKISVYASLVERVAVRRLLLTAADEIKAVALDEEQAIEVVTAAAEAKILRAIGGGAGKPLESIGEIAGEVWEQAAQIRENGKVRPIATPWRKLDDYNLLIPGRYGIIAGRPGMGKSWLLLVLALHLAQMGYPVFFFSLEMSKSDLTERALSALSGVQSQKIDNATATAQEWGAFTDALGRLSNMPLYIDTPPSGLPMTPALLRARVRRGMHQLPTNKTAFVMLDYIQHERMSGGERFERQTNRHRELSYASASLASLAVDTGSHVIVAAQLGRDVVDRADKRPRKEDLKESGSLEQDAWWVLLLHSDDYYNQPQAIIVELEMIIDKNRGGRLGTEKFQFDKSTGAMW